MWPDWVSIPGPLALESDALATGLCGLAPGSLTIHLKMGSSENKDKILISLKQQR